MSNNNKQNKNEVQPERRTVIYNQEEHLRSQRPTVSKLPPPPPPKKK